MRLFCCIVVVVNIVVAFLIFVAGRAIKVKLTILEATAVVVVDFVVVDIVIVIVAVVIFNVVIVSLPVVTHHIKFSSTKHEFPIGTKLGV